MMTVGMDLKYEGIEEIGRDFFLFPGFFIPFHSVLNDSSFSFLGGMVNFLIRL